MFSEFKQITNLLLDGLFEAGLLACVDFSVGGLDLLGVFINDADLMDLSDLFDGDGFLGETSSLIMFSGERFSCFISMSLSCSFFNFFFILSFLSSLSLSSSESWYINIYKSSTLENIKKWQKYDRNFTFKDFDYLSNPLIQFQKQRNKSGNYIINCIFKFQSVILLPYGITALCKTCCARYLISCDSTCIGKVL